MALIDKLTNIADAIRNLTDSTDNMTLDEMNTRLNNFNFQFKLYCYKPATNNVEYYVDIDGYWGHPLNRKDYYYIFKKSDSGSLFQELAETGGYGILQSDGTIYFKNVGYLIKIPNKTVMLYAYFTE